jgi:hypothetical protein
MEPLEVLITLLQIYRNRTCGCYYGNRSVPTTADTIDENNEDFSIALERLRLLEQSMIMMRLNCDDHPASATEGSPV